MLKLETSQLCLKCSTWHKYDSETHKKFNYDTYFSNKIINQPVKKENVDYLNMKQQNALYRKQQNKIKKVETQISNLENQINMLNNQLQDESVLNDYQKYNQINDEINLLENNLNELMEEWEALQ